MSDERYDPLSEQPLMFNRTAIRIPFFRVGYREPDLASLYEIFRDFKVAR